MKKIVSGIVLMLALVSLSACSNKPSASESKSASIASSKSLAQKSESSKKAAESKSSKAAAAKSESERVAAEKSQSESVAQSLAASESQSAAIAAQEQAAAESKKAARPSNEVIAAMFTQFIMPEWKDVEFNVICPQESDGSYLLGQGSRFTTNFVINENDVVVKGDSVLNAGSSATIDDLISKYYSTPEQKQITDELNATILKNTQEG